jgi:SAM-dependent methyltransferase
VPDGDGALDAFHRIYESDHWKGGSGAGSNIEATSAYRAVLQAVLGASEVATVVDAGCGDWQFSRLVDWSGIRYTGVDIVPEVVAANAAAFGRDGIGFVAADVRTETLPTADLLICKDVLQHWDLDSIQGFLARNLPHHRYALITNDIASVHIAPDMLNAEIPIGAWRPLDVERAPFSRRASWRLDYDVRGEWTKRCLLYVRRRDFVAAALRPGSALRQARRTGAGASASG